MGVFLRATTPSEDGKRFAAFFGPLVAALTLIAHSSSAFAGAVLVDRWSFTTDTSDSVGTANLTLFGGATVSGGQLQLPGGNVQTDYAAATGSSLSTLAATINGASAITMEMWFTDTSGASYAKVFMAGTDDRSTYIDVTPNKFGANSQEIRTNSVGEVDNSAAPVTSNPWYVSATWDTTNDTMTMFSGPVGGSLTEVQTSMDGALLSDLNINFFALGESEFADPDMQGSIDEARLWTGSFSAADAAADFAAGPNVIPTIPEPGTVALLCVGLAGLGSCRRRKV